MAEDRMVAPTLLLAADTCTPAELAGLRAGLAALAGIKKALEGAR
jgi:hypothetical protein